MNTSYKCNCCAKESVCKYSEEYKHDCEQIQKNIVGKTTEVMTDNIVKLPCGVGGTIYNISSITNKIDEHTVISITFLLSKSVNHLSLHAANYRGAVMAFETVDYNKTWFTDKSAAEARLAELKGDTK